MLRPYKFVAMVGGEVGANSWLRLRRSGFGACGMMIGLMEGGKSGGNY